MVPLVHTNNYQPQQGSNGGQPNPPPVPSMRVTGLQYAHLVRYNGDNNTFVQNEEVKSTLRQRECSRSPDRYIANLPFSEFIMSIPLLDHLKFLPLDSYDGMINSQEHLGMFNSAMLISGVIGPTMCQTFPSTLKNLVCYGIFH